MAEHIQTQEQEDGEILSPGCTLLNCDMMRALPAVPDKSVDLLLCDFPYGTTELEWDKRPDLNAVFKELKRIIKDHGAIICFGQQPFGSDLINTWRKGFRYEITWDKIAPTGFLNANRMPLRVHENLYVFYKHLPTYNPQKVPGGEARTKKRTGTPGHYHHTKRLDRDYDGMKMPTDIIRFTVRTNLHNGHPTEKPVALYDWLIKTYTNPGDMVLDPCFGSGNSGTAALRNGRKYIGIELDKGYYNAAKDKLSAVLQEKKAL